MRRNIKNSDSNLVYYVKKLLNIFIIMENKGDENFIDVSKDCSRLKEF